jgi:hypothetical protein
LRTVVEDPETGGKKARWIKRGPDHFAHADSYAEIAHRRVRGGQITATIIGPDGIWPTPRSASRIPSAPTGA